MTDKHDDNSQLLSRLEAVEKKIHYLDSTISELEREYHVLLSFKPDIKAGYDAARMAYSEYGNQIRHFSTTRSALTTFLVTAGMTAFASYLDKKIQFLFWAGIVLAIAAACTCLWFSYQTERHVIRYKDIWNLLNGKESVARIDDLNYDSNKVRGCTIALRMLKDPMNWLLLGAVIAFLRFAFLNFLYCPAH